jgi:cytochrome c oxidase subunit I
VANAHAQAHGHTVKRYTGLLDWLTTVDHKKIGILYMMAGALMFVVGGIEALLIRFQLFGPNLNVLDAQTYNEMITMHGTTMIFMAAMPLVFAFMNAVVPLLIGARDVAFPFLNSLGFWLFFFGAVLLNISWFVGEVPDAGWTAYVPLSGKTFSSHLGVDFYLMGLQISGIGTLIGGINFLVTIINMRAPGMSFMRMPMFAWTSFITSAMILFAFPALTVGLVLLTFDRLFGGNIFDPNGGGNPVLWQHIFWIFGHPEVYILVLPAFGIISEVVPTFSRKRLFGYSAMVFATVLIGFLGFMVWAHHMFTTGMGPVANALFGVASMLIAIPTGIKIFNWIFTMWGGQVRFTTANLFAISFIPTFVMGGVTGVMLAVPTADWQFHDSYFVVAHFHYVIVGGIVMGLFAGFYYWFPKMFGRMLNETLGKLNFWLFFIGFHLTFFIQHIVGLLGMPRRVFTYLGEDQNPGWTWMNQLSTIGAVIMGLAVVILLINVVVTMTKPRTAKADPWDGRTLEWSIPSPAPEYNFAQTPLVRGIDAFWKEKMAGNSEMTPAEPLGPIHMPSPSFIPFFMSLGLFVAAFGFMYAEKLGGHWLAIVGLVFTFLCMFLRSVIDDHGFHIDPNDKPKKGVQA